MCSQNMYSSTCILLVPSPFGELDCVVKDELLYRYCSNCFGSILQNQNCHYDVTRSSARRTALRRVWSVQDTQTSVVTTALSCRLPLIDALCRRVSIFHSKSMNNARQWGHQACLSLDHCLTAYKIRYLKTISDTYGFSFSSFEQCAHMATIVTHFICLTETSTTDVDGTILDLPYELIMLRDCILTFQPLGASLNRSETNPLIAFVRNW